MATPESKIARRKTIVAVVAGPLFLVPTFSVIGFFVSLLNSLEVSDFLMMMIKFPMWGVTAAVLAYPVTLFYGVPAVIVLRSVDKFTLPMLLLVSLIPAWLIFCVILPSISGWLLYSYLSAVVAVCCWFVYERA